MIVDKREFRIVLQNSMGHATRIALHNSKGKEVAPDKVFEIAVEIAKMVMRYGTPNQNNMPHATEID